MGINIKNDEVEALIRAYAAEEGVGVTDAIKRAVEVARAARAAGRSGRAKRRLAAFRSNLAALGGPFPAIDQKAIDDELYDERGAPR